ncbi:MAG TPA: Hsp70 family protein [Anaerolineales bacterium]|nr:Hsp70 family protein [Anaerolineales bacterium]
MTLRVGIDFGTSNSGVAAYDGRSVHLLPVDPHSAMPGVIKTILYITRDQRPYVGQEAVELYYRQNVNRLRRFVKKWAGEIDVRGSDMHYVHDVYTFVDELSPGRLLQYIKTALRSPGYQGTQIFDRYYTLGEIITLYLHELKRRAEDLLHEKIGGVVLGRPVQFHSDPELDRRAEETLRQAALEAGFAQVSFELEPVAAALDYEQGLARPQTSMIFDFGGGTLDITIMRLGDPAHRQVYASRGLGIAGSDFDRAIIEKRLLTHFGLGRASLSPELQELVHAVADWSALPDLSTPPVRLRLEKAILESGAPARLKALQALIFNDLAFSFYNAVETAKINLSSQGVAVIGLKEKDLDLWELYTRRQFETDIMEHRQAVEQLVLEAVAAAGLEPPQVDAVVKTGGSSNIPAFGALLEGLFGAERVRSSDAFSSVTAGLAIRAMQG